MKKSQILKSVTSPLKAKYTLRYVGDMVKEACASSGVTLLSNQVQIYNNQPLSMSIEMVIIRNTVNIPSYVEVSVNGVKAQFDIDTDDLFIYDIRDMIVAAYYKQLKEEANVKKELSFEEKQNIIDINVKVAKERRALHTTKIDTEPNEVTLVLQKLTATEHLRITNFAKSIGVTL